MSAAPPSPRSWLPRWPGPSSATASAIWSGAAGGRRLLDGSVGRLVRREHLDRAERYLADRGGPAVFFGRFTAALRALIPGLAGMAGLQYRTFALYNAVGGAIWASGFVLLGYVAGTGWRQVEAVAKRASLLLLLTLAATALLVITVRCSSATPTASPPWSTANSSGPGWPGSGTATSANWPFWPGGCDPAGRWGCSGPARPPPSC